MRDVQPPGYCWVSISHLSGIPVGCRVRLARQIGRAMGFLFDVPYTVDPRALMRRIRTPDELDGLSTNFFPPNQVVFERNARRMGLPDLLAPPPGEKAQLTSGDILKK